MNRTLQSLIARAEVHGMIVFATAAIFAMAGFDPADEFVGAGWAAANSPERVIADLSTEDLKAMAMGLDALAATEPRRSARLPEILLRRREVQAERDRRDQEKHQSSTAP
jgi:hypothetical protein